ncbi:pre-peptidase C-terminal domain-containing protein [Thermomonas sp.]|uniref:M4 family metallopeptidase n=1 Tax=Thermomonas sp. TaxID=1971895 RepID=UPI002489E7E5|nr:pre-peptidase C-terminal domain-containing protein [Thermomonas sp.]MDI1254432.1 M4 family metallopeptidase [Thermomonas sp.]
MNRFSALATAITLSLVATGAQAASRSDLNQKNIAQLKQQYQSIAANHGIAPMAHSRHEQFISADANSRLLMKAKSEDHGVRNYRYDQTFRGIPVFGEGIVVSEDGAGNVRKLFGNMVGGLDQDIASTTPKITRGAALAAGKSSHLGSRLSAYRTENEKSDLVVFVDDKGQGHLAYAVSYFADGANVNPTRPMILIDANSGRVLKKWENLQHSLIGTGPGGNAKTGQYEFGTTYGYLDVTQSGTTCTMNSTNVKTVNLNNASTNTSNTAFTYACPRNTVKAINGAYSPLNDAHYFGAVIQNMYNAYTGANALSFQLVMKVHYKTGYENAFWNGTAMSFGDGASTFYPLVNADVSGHEVSHGFTEQHSNLTYSGMSGGINESFSDMGGEATEYFWKGTNDFNVGTEIFKATGALRYMCNPPQDGGSIDNAANYTSSMDVHYTSGVYNKAFCTLAKKTGWTTKKAFQVFARANANYWTSSITYNQGACGVETAATDLGFTKADVTAAFSVVGVSCATTPPPPSGGGVLTNGVAKTGQSGAAGASLTYTMVVPAGATSLKFVTSGGTGDSDLYAKFGSAPTTTSNDCKSEGGTTAETCTIATAQAGTYYVLVKGYSAFSGVSITGSYTAGGGGGGSCGGLVLCDNVGVALPSVAKGSFSSDYTMAIAAGHTVIFTISGGTGDADMYVRAGSAPTTSSYDCRPYASGNSETCTFTPTSATTYHIKVNAYAAFSGVTLKGDTN